MAVLSNLKITSETRHGEKDPKEIKRKRMLSAIAEQRLLVEGLIKGKKVELTKTVYETDPETGIRGQFKRPKKARPWFWHNVDGIWYLEVRYANKTIDFGKGNKAIEIGDKSRLLEVLDLLADAVSNGELDTQIAAAGKRLPKD